MDQETYRNTQEMLFLQAALIREMPLEEFIEAIDRANTLGPFLATQDWIKAADNLDHIRALAESMLKVKRTANQILSAVSKEQR